MLQHFLAPHPHFSLGLTVVLGRGTAVMLNVVSFLHPSVPEPKAAALVRGQKKYYASLLS